MAITNKVAVVTGASRGIGRGCALELAKAGFDVVICARTLKEGTSFEHSSSVKRSDTTPLPGSLEKTQQEIEELGRRALPVKLDLALNEDIENVAKQTLDAFGRVDVLVNNARFIGPGHMDPFLATPIKYLELHDRCNVVGPLYLTQLLVQKMIEQGGGIVFTIDSAAGWQETAAPVGNGGFGLGYAITKAAMHRMPLGLGKEFKEHNVAVVNVDPGLVGTERIAQDMAKFGVSMDHSQPINIPGLCIAHIANHKYPMVFSGRMVESFNYVVEHELVDASVMPDLYGPEAWGVPMPWRLLPERVAGWIKQ
jgi:NAD(P)-dependent dehydrogenase (short-subunit alcohol dehydrogenase family)